MVRLSLPASVLWKQFATDVERRQLPEGDLRSISGWASKLAGLAGRIALTFHVAEGYALQDPISEAVMTYSLEMSKHLIEHAKVALSIAREDENTRLAEVILRHIQNKQPSSISAREVLTNCWGGCSSSDEATQALLKLCDHGYLAEEPTETRGKVGRPRSSNFKINPAILTCKTSKTPTETNFAGFAGCFQEVKNEFSTRSLENAYIREEV